MDNLTCLYLPYDPGAHLSLVYNFFPYVVHFVV